MVKRLKKAACTSLTVLICLDSQPDAVAPKDRTWCTATLARMCLRLTDEEAWRVLGLQVLGDLIAAAPGANWWREDILALVRTVCAVGSACMRLSIF